MAYRAMSFKGGTPSARGHECQVRQAHLLLCRVGGMVKKKQCFVLWCAQFAPGDCPVALANLRFLKASARQECLSPVSVTAGPPVSTRVSFEGTTCPALSCG
jgi:hypothetical protein